LVCGTSGLEADVLPPSPGTVVTSPALRLARDGSGRKIQFSHVAATFAPSLRSVKRSIGPRENRLRPLPLVHECDANAHADAAVRAGVTYKLLERFRALFDGEIYRHRVSTNGDKVAVELYDDLLSLARSKKYVADVRAGSRVVNSKNLITRKPNRRGDGSFGELLPHLQPEADSGFGVPRGPTANIEIGVETKTLAKAMIKQVDRVLSDLENQARVFRSRGNNPICVAVVGINRAQEYLSYGGKRDDGEDVTFLTTGSSGRRHPCQEYAEAERRIRQRIDPIYELIVLPFDATNQSPHSFAWANAPALTNAYGAALIRISQEYEKRFYSRIAPTLTRTNRASPKSQLSLTFIGLKWCATQSRANPSAGIYPI
jgi:hypothetical protein